MRVYRGSFFCARLLLEMKQKFRKIAPLLVFLMFLVRVPRVWAQNLISERTCKSPYTDCGWQFHSRNPIIVPNTSSVYEDRDNIYAPDVHYENGVYRMWYGGQGQGNHDRILYATSVNGVNWSKKGLALNVGASTHVNDPSVVKVGGQYYMYYTDNIGGAPPGDTIHLATSVDGTSWTKKGQVLYRGVIGQWDSLFVSRPSVIYEDGLFKMWYDSCPLACQIGYATSVDGFSWTKYSGNPLPIYTSAIDVEHMADGYLMLGQAHSGTLIFTSVNETDWVAKGYLFGLSGKDYDRYGQVTPNIFLNEEKEWVGIYFGGASDACWCKNRIGLAYLPVPTVPPFTIQGFKKYCPDGTKVILDGGAEVTVDPYFFYNVSGVSHTIALEVPTPISGPGYEVLHSACDGCIEHPNSSYVLGNPYSFDKETATAPYYDLYWKCSIEYDLDRNGVFNLRDWPVLFNEWSENISSKADLFSDNKINALDYGKIVNWTEDL